MTGARTNRPGTGTRRPARPRVALAPMMPTPGADPDLVDDAWLLSPLREGWRCLALLDDRVRLRTRAGRDVAPLVPAVAGALADLRRSRGSGRGAEPTILDGILVAPPATGGQPPSIAQATGFEILDTLCVSGRDVTGRDLHGRRTALAGLGIRDRDGLRVAPAWRGSVRDALEQGRHAGRHGVGVVLARRTAVPYRPASSTADWLVFGAAELRERVLCGIAGSGALVLGVATSHGLAFAGVARPTRAWRGLALLCDEGPPPFPMPRVWASLGPIAWARPDVWVAVAADERPGAGRGGPRWRFVRWQQDLLVAERSPERVATALSLMPEASAGERA